MIKSLQLVDFKPFRDTGKIKLGSLNILAGTNGKGKSSLLQGLLLLSQSIRQSEQHIPDNLQINGDYVNLGSFDDLINTNAGSKSFQFHLVTDSENDNDFLMSYTKIDGEDEWGRLFSLKVNGIEKFSNAGFYIDEGGENQAPEIIAPAFSGYTSLIRIQKLYYVAAAREASRGEEELVPASKHIHLDCQGRNVLNVMYKQGPDFCRMLEEHGTGFAGQCLEDALEVTLLEGQQVSNGLAALFLVRGQNHAAHEVNAIAAEEHVLGAAKTDTLCAEGDGGLHLVGGVGIRAHAQLAGAAAPFHHAGEVAVGVAVFGFEGFVDEHLHHL